MPDREAVIAYSALLEGILEDTLLANMLVLNETRFNELFRDQNAPLQSLSAKIILAHSLGIISDEMRVQMTTVRKLRNAFAHTILAIDFQSPTIAREAMKLDVKRMLLPHVTTTFEESGPRGRFEDACTLFVVHLLEYIQSVLDAIRSGQAPKPATYRSKYA